MPQIVMQKTTGTQFMMLDHDAYEKLDSQVVFELKEASSGSMSMKSLWWSWMSSTAVFMSARGVTMPLMISAGGQHFGSRAFDKEDAHELFAAQWMGTDENGKRYSWKMRSPAHDETIAPKSMRLYAMEKHQVWCAERGINILNPESSEFRKLQMQQEV